MSDERSEPLKPPATPSEGGTPGGEGRAPAAPEAPPRPADEADANGAARADGEEGEGATEGDGAENGGAEGDGAEGDGAKAEGGARKKKKKKRKAKGEAGEVKRGAGGKAASKAPPAWPGGRFTWGEIEAFSTFAGLASFGGLIAAAATRNSQWPAAPFVLLFYLMLLSAAVASYAARRAGRGALDWVSTLIRRALWVLVGVLAVWVWLPPAQYAYYWLYRHLSVFLLT